MNSSELDKKTRIETGPQAVAIISAVIRWLLFIPVGLVTGFVAFIILTGVFTSSISGGDQRFLSFWGVIGELLGGFLSVLVGMFIAPRGGRIVAGIIMDGACVVLAVIVAYIGWSVNDPGIRIYPLLGMCIYCSSAVITSVVSWRLLLAAANAPRN